MQERDKRKGSSQWQWRVLPGVLAIGVLVIVLLANVIGSSGVDRNTPAKETICKLATRKSEWVIEVGVSFFASVIVGLTVGFDRSRLGGTG